MHETIFKIERYQDPENKIWYKWCCKLNDKWEESTHYFPEKGQCFLDFVCQNIYLRKEGVLVNQ